MLATSFEDCASTGVVIISVRNSMINDASFQVLTVISKGSILRANPNRSQSPRKEGQVELFGETPNEQLWRDANALTER